MFIIRIKILNKTVYLKENLGSFYNYTHNILDAKQWVDEESANKELKSLNISLFENLDIINIKDKYFVNTFNKKIENVNTDIKYPYLYDDIDEALIHLDVIKDRPDDYENLSFNTYSDSESSDNDGQSGRVPPEE